MMVEGITESEKFVSSLCEKSFLQLWTHPNPKGKKNKELCDCLIVCGSDIIIISVKECDYKDTGDETGLTRWIKAAIEKSVSQIWGAERWLQSVNHVVRHDGREISLPDKDKRQYHRVSVSIGGRGHIPIQWGDFGNGFIHICDEHSASILFGALDTITDLVHFLRATEELVSSGVNIICAGGGIEDLVALYLINGRSFEYIQESGECPHMLIVSDDLWKGFESNEYQALQEGYKNSYIWDRLINYYSHDLLTDGMFDMHNKKVTYNELALVQMALQPRRARVVLAKGFIEFLQQPELNVASRAIKGDGNTAFVFLIGKTEAREHRARELWLRSYVVRGRFPDVTTVVGIATDRPGTSEIGYSSDISYLHILEWTDEDDAKVAGIQADLGYFNNLS